MGWLQQIRAIVKGVTKIRRCETTDGINFFRIAALLISRHTADC